MTTCEQDYTRAAAHAEIDRQIAAFLAAGGRITPIPRGAMAETGWTPAERIERARPTVKRPSEIAQRARAEHAERIARKVAEKAMPLICRPAIKRFAAPGTHKAQVLALLAQGPATANELARAIGATRNTIAVALSALKRRGLVRSEGAKPTTQYHLA